MTINTSLFTGVAGNYSLIASNLTPIDGNNFVSIIDALSAHAASTTNVDGKSNTLDGYIQNGVRVDLSALGSDPTYLPSLITLVSWRLLASTDNIHVALTPLGKEFYNYIQEP